MPNGIPSPVGTRPRAGDVGCGVPGLLPSHSDTRLGGLVLGATVTTRPNETAEMIVNLVDNYGRRV